MALLVFKWLYAFAVFGPKPPGSERPFPTCGNEMEYLGTDVKDQ